ncbi:type II methionyl aminopeptidase, partial [Halobacteriales archaeon SW_7_68_16]
IADQFHTLPFATRWIDVPRPEMAIRRLKRNDLVHGYPVLKEAAGQLVSQREHTLIVTENGCEVTTRAG